MEGWWQPDTPTLFCCLADLLEDKLMHINNIDCKVSLKYSYNF
jgi:hypothetical protein